MVGALTLAGCALTGPEDLRDEQRELNRSRRQWEAAAIEDYRLVARRLCYCGTEVIEPVVVEVSGGEPVSRTYQATGQPVPEQFEELWPTMDGVFAIVQNAIDREAHRIDVEYDPALGFPTSIAIDYLEHAIDEEMRFDVIEMQPLE